MSDLARARGSAPSPISSTLQTFLIADVRGYTRFTAENGDGAAARLASRFAALAEEVVAHHGGRVVELRGDEALCSFPSARDALRAALALRAAFREATELDPSLPLPVGMGLDAGEAIPVEGGYRGGALNLAARLCSLAGAGEVFCSQTVTGLARRTEGIAFIDRGEAALKGIPAPVKVIQVAPEGELSGDLPPLQTSPPPLPSGIVTFLYTDIEGSTRLWQEYPELMPSLLARHDALVAEAVEAQGGIIFRTMGDALCAAFSSPPAALSAACAAQRSLAAEPWEGGCALRVRMAIHTGPAEVRGGDYVGHTLNRVARLLTAGHGGQSLLSAATRELAGERLPEATELLDLGEHRLKDLAQLERVYQLCPRGLPRDFPPLVTAGGQATNLPVQATPFIGRERELAEIAARLRDSDVRLLTLTGPGGTGKTRLALEAAASVLPHTRDGVFAVFLAPLSDPSLVPSAIAEALGVKEQAGRDLLQAVVDHLRERGLLLVLDNYEHLLGAADVVSRLLASCRGLRVLVTSRIPLHLSGEREYAVPPLSLPDPRNPADPITLSRYDALVFFVDRARAVKADFALTDENAASVAAICRKLDGLPLALELAAARIKIFPPPALLQRLSKSLQLLTGGAKDKPTRQQTLRAAIDWSYSLLSVEEQTLFARLSVFAGGCDLEAAEAICHPTGALDLLEGMASLVDKSLLRQEGEEEPRFDMLETIREYAAERLEERDDSGQLRQRHAEYFLSIAQEAVGQIYGPDQARWLNRLQDEHDNLRAALSWTRDSGDLETGLRVATGILHYWHGRGHHTEGLRWLKQLLTVEARDGRAASPGARVEAHFIAAFLVVVLGDADEARALAEEGMRLARESPDRRDLAVGLGIMSWMAREWGDYGRAVTLAEESLALSRELELQRHIANAFQSLGDIARDRGDPAGVERYCEEALATYREEGDSRWVAYSLHNLGRAAQMAGDYGRATALCQESLELLRELGDPGSIAEVLTSLGLSAHDQGDDEEAARLFREGLTALRTGPLLPLYTVRALEGMAGVAAARREGERAARLFGAADAVRTRMGFPVRPVDRALYERDVEAAWQGVGEQRFTAAWNGGRSMSLEEAVAVALTENVSTDLAP